jgi:hypothetical protein
MSCNLYVKHWVEDNVKDKGRRIDTWIYSWKLFQNKHQKKNNAVVFMNLKML